MAPPENELQKTAHETITESRNISEHELRFRKSVEKLNVPDWYRDYGTRARDRSPSRQSYEVPPPPTTTLDRSPRMYDYRYGQ